MAEPINAGADIEDVEDILEDICKTFGIMFAGKELIHVSTFGDLCNSILAKIKVADSNTETYERAFEVLTTGIAEHKKLNKDSMKADTKMSSLFYWYKRKLNVLVVESKMGMYMDILKPAFVSIYVCIALLAAAICGRIFINPVFNFAIMGCAGLSIYMGLFSRRFTARTVGEVTEKMVKERHSRFHRDMPEAEIIKVVENKFIDKLCVPDFKNGIKPDDIIIDRRV